MNRGRKILANDRFQEVGSLYGLGEPRITEKIDMGRGAGRPMDRMPGSIFAVIVSATGG